MSNTLRISWVCVLFLASTGYAHAQASKPRAPLPPLARIVTQAAPAAGAIPTTPSNFNATYVGSKQVDLSWTASTPPAGATIKEYVIYRCEGTATACRSLTFTKIADDITTNSYSDKDDKNNSLNNPLKADTDFTYKIVATDDKGKSSEAATVSIRTTHFTCQLLPVRPGCMAFGLDKDPDTNRNNNINAFYQTNGTLSFFNQVKSLYNGASGSATVSADIATLNFSNGMQAVFATNVQAGPSGTTTPSSGTIPTLTANGAGQATQNMLFGGTVLAREMYPLAAAGGSKLGSPGGLGLLLDFIAKEGVDIQNFKSGTNVNVSSPPFHGSAQIEGYLQYNSINLAPSTASSTPIFAGALFVGGSYGYSYVSHGYARDYGFGKQYNNGIGQISFGVLINGVAKISVSRAFGPSQTYIDSTTMAQTTVNNFKAWSFGITYQSGGLAPK